MGDEVLTIKEIAEFLKRAKKTVYSMVQRGRLPMPEVCGQWRILRADVDRWMPEQRKRSDGAGPPERPRVGG